MILSIIAVAVDFADLAVIDLSKASAPEGQAELVQQVRKALPEVGFFYVINHGYTPSQTARIFDIASLTFDQISDEEKKEHARKDQGCIEDTNSGKNGQPIGGLQILSKDNKWRWIKHIDNAIYLSGGYYPATRHRVIQHPVDQRNIRRPGVFYFAMANDDVGLSPLAHSPLLRKEGIKKYFEDGAVPIMEGRGHLDMEGANSGPVRVLRKKLFVELLLSISTKSCVEVLIPF